MGDPLKVALVFYVNPQVLNLSFPSENSAVLTAIFSEPVIHTLVATGYFF